MQSEGGTNQEFELELQDISSRDWQLWSLGILVLVVVALGFISLSAPALGGVIDLTQLRLLPQLFSGFIALVVLFNLYILDQKRRLNATRDRLLSRMLREPRPEGGILFDPLTQVFSAQYFDQAVTREVSRVERQHCALTFLVVDVMNLRSIGSRFGMAAKDHLLSATAELLRSRLRGSDIICRYGAERFVALLTDTDGQQASFPAARISRAVEQWNGTTSFQYKMQLSVRTAPFLPGVDWNCLVLDPSQGGDGADKRMSGVRQTATAAS